MSRKSVLVRLRFVLVIRNDDCYGWWYYLRHGLVRFVGAHTHGTHCFNFVWFPDTVLDRISPYSKRHFVPVHIRRKHVRADAKRHEEKIKENAGGRRQDENDNGKWTHGSCNSDDFRCWRFRRVAKSRFYYDRVFMQRAIMRIKIITSHFPLNSTPLHFVRTS